ncbi:MAG: universal stress protein [Solirubrobacteraceae bacterium]|jgi:nucleotide-binding universal stress UspA family protein
MTRVVAAIADDAAAPGVLATAIAISKLHAATVEAVHVGEDRFDAAIAEAARSAGVTLRTVAGSPVEALARAAEAEDVHAIVLGVAGKRPPGSTALALITALEKRVVVVPADGAASRSIERVLVALDGTAQSAAALEETVKFLCDAAVEIVVAHVYGEPAALPAFSDHLAHEVRAWSEEFIARNCPAAVDATLELRVGEPHEQVLDILRDSGCNLVALAWSRDLSPGRAAVVRRMLVESSVPVLLTPTGIHAAPAMAGYGRRAGDDPSESGS